MQISSLRLPRFDPSAEDRYHDDLTQRVMPLGRLGAALGGLLFLAFSLWDRLLDPTAVSSTLPLRVLVAALFGLAFLATFTPWGRRRIGPYMALHAALAVGFTLILAALPDGFLVGVPGFLLAMSVVPIFSTKLWHIGAGLASIVVLPNVVMVAEGASSFEIQQANFWLLSGAVAAGSLGYLMQVDRRRAFAAQLALEEEQRRSESLLLNILPADIVDRLKQGAASTSDAFPEATVLFADIAGFTDFAESMAAADLVDFLNELFGTFDDIAAAHGIEKIKTIGDSYMAVAGVPLARPDHAAAAVAAGTAMVEFFSELCDRRGLGLGLRVGVHTGPLVGGVIGKRKFSYDVWGDTVNVASRMESSGVPGRVQVSDATRSRLAAPPPLTSRGLVELKGHSPMEAFLVG